MNSHCTFLLCIGISLVAQNGCSHFVKRPLDTSLRGGLQELPANGSTVVPTENINGMAAVKLAGEASVTRTGAASYTIPLRTIPGRAGIEPRLGLLYSSEASNGILGVGWAVAGLSTIARCPRTIAQDGFSRGIQFQEGEGGDRYCLNGTRLILVKGLHGAAGAEYRIEKGVYSKVIVMEADSSGPMVFVEYQKAGNIVTYGDAERGANGTVEGSRHTIKPDANGKPVEDFSQWVRQSWAEVQTADRHGNFLTVRYGHIDSARAYESFPLRIEYTGFLSLRAPLKPDRTVEFHYETRPDKSDFYTAGLHLQRTVRVARISSQEGAKVWRSWDIKYGQSLGTNRSLIDRIKECDVGGVCTPSSRFKWTEGSPSFTRLNIGAAFHNDSRGQSFGDLNADGKTDLLTSDFRGLYSQVSTGRTFTAKVPVNLPVLPPLECNGSSVNTYPQFAPASANALVDFDADGKDDFVGAWYRFVTGESYDQWGQPYMNPCTVERSLGLFRNTTTTGSQSIEFSLSFSTPFAPVHYQDFPRMVDLDGDGLPELLFAFLPGAYYGNYGYHRNLGGGNFGAYLPFSPESPQNGRSQFISSDETGHGALLGGYWQHRLIGDIMEVTPAPILGGGTLEDRFAVDVNGDGLTDIVKSEHVREADYGLFVSINTGNGFTPSRRWTLDGQFSSHLLSPYTGQVTIDDFDGDGAEDLISLSTVISSAADGAFKTWVLDDDVPHTQRALLDLNGDGLLDYYRASPNWDERDVYLRGGVRADLLSRVTDGFGAFEDFSYKHSGDGSVYEPQSEEAVYPLSPGLGGLWVVAQWSVGQNSTVERSLDYSYERGRFHLQGRGWLGFARVIVTEPITGLVTENDYGVAQWVGPTNQNAWGNYPIADYLVKQKRTVVVDGVTFRSELESHPAYGKDTNGIYALKSLLSSVVEHEQRADSPAVTNRSAHVLTNFDEDGNEWYHREQVRWHDGAGIERMAQVEIGSQFERNVDTWIIGKLKQVLSTSRTMARDEQTRTHTFESDPITGKYTRQTIEPDSTDRAMRLDTTFTYDDYGLLEKVEAVDAFGRRRSNTIAYDSARHIFPERFTNALRHTRQLRHHSALGVMETSADENGIVTQFQYDGFGRLRDEISPFGDNLWVSYALKDSGVVEVVAKRAGHSGLVTKHDAVGREIQRIWQAFNGRWLFQDTKYDRLGRPKSSTLPFYQGQTPVSVVTTYDALGRVSRLSKPDGNARTLEYRGRTVTIRDEDGRQTRLEVDGVGNVTRSVAIDTAGREIASHYAYGPFNQMVAAADAGEHWAYMSYDIRGRRTDLLDPDSGRSTIAYNAFGDVEGTWAAESGWTDYQVDDLGRVEQISSRDGKTTFTWDSSTNGIGRLASATSASEITTSLSYDTLGRERERTWWLPGDRPYSTINSFDDFGRLKYVSYYPHVLQSGGLTTRVDYTDSGRVKSITDVDTQQPYWAINDETALGQTERESFGNGVETVAGYDMLGQLKSLISSRHGEILQHVAYDYSGSGLLTARQDRLIDASEAFEHDFVKRLKVWTTTSGSSQSKYEYNYDDTGNLLSRVTLQGPGLSRWNTYGEAGAYMGAHALTSSTVGSTVGRYTYDRQGNQTSGPGRVIDFTAFNLPRRVLGPEAVATFDYDAFHRRARKVTTGGLETITLGDGYERRSARGSPTAHVFRIHGSGRVVAEVVWTEGADGIASKDVIYLHADRLGSSDTRTNSEGDVIERHRFDPFGVSTPLGTPGGTSLYGSTIGFTGYSPEDESGLVDAGGRLYDPQTGRFLSPDPLASGTLSTQALNRYAYVWNSPLSYTDPSGLDPSGGTLTGQYFGVGGFGFFFSFHYSSDSNSAYSGDVPIYGEGGGGRGYTVNSRTPRKVNDGGLRSAGLFVARRAVMAVKVGMGMKQAFVGMGEEWGLPTDVRNSAQWARFLSNFDPIQIAQGMATGLTKAWHENGAMGPVDMLNPMTRVLSNGAMAVETYQQGDLKGYGYYSVHLGMAILDTAALSKGLAGLGKSAGTIRLRGFENVAAFDSFDHARTAAREFAGLGDNAVPFVQELGPLKGRVTGSMSADGLRGWRLDFDASKGFHVNWWDRSLGAKRSSWIYGANTVPSRTYGDYLNLLEHAFPKR